MTEEADPRAVLYSAISQAEKEIEKIKGSDSRALAQRLNEQFAPNVDVPYLFLKMKHLREYIEGRDKKSLIGLETQIKEQAEKLSYCGTHTLPHLMDSRYCRYVVAAFLVLLDDIELFFAENSKPLDPKACQRRLTTLRKEIRSLEAGVEDSKSQLGEVKGSINTILEARDAALALPETLDTLKKTNAEISGMHKEVLQFRDIAKESSQFIKSVDSDIREKQSEIKGILSKCEDALRASTGVGLAAAFSKHADTLRKSSRCWVVALFAALASMVLIGFLRMNSILQMMDKQGVDASVIGLNMAMSLFMLAAPVWLAWIAAKRISHLFRLIEDYEFKAAISSAYEGYRREAERFEERDFSERVLDSALTRFDEPPLRFVEKNEQVHPLIELLQFLTGRKRSVENKKLSPQASTTGESDREENS